MQQTKTHKFNLIESSDAFLPAALNENMEKLETALSNTQTQLAQQITSTENKLNQRVAALEAHKIIVGYDSANTGFINLGVTPMAVFARGKDDIHIATYGHADTSMTVRDGGFSRGSSIGPCVYVAII